MHRIERTTIKSVAKLAPWLAPIPSAFFVGRSAMAHLTVPLPVAVIVAAIVETLGLASVHTWLWLSDWNAARRKSDPVAPVRLAVILGGVYLAATIGLTVALEIAPTWATYAPALFPILAVVGAVNLALIAQQEQREAMVEAERAEKRGARQVHKSRAQQAPLGDVASVHSDDGRSARASAQNAVLDAVNRTRQERKAALKSALVDAYRDNPSLGATEAARALGVHRNTIYGYTAELEAAGRIRRNGHQVEVVEG